jgi:hypothetical protein
MGLLDILSPAPEVKWGVGICVVFVILMIVCSIYSAKAEEGGFKTFLTVSAVISAVVAGLGAGYAGVQYSPWSYPVNNFWQSSMLNPTTWSFGMGGEDAKVAEKPYTQPPTPTLNDVPIAPGSTIAPGTFEFPKDSSELGGFLPSNLQGVGQFPVMPAMPAIPEMPAIPAMIKQHGLPPLGQGQYKDPMGNFTGEVEDNKFPSLESPFVSPDTSVASGPAEIPPLSSSFDTSSEAA